MRKKFVAGNWKMHGSRSEVKALVQGIKQGTEDLSNIDIAVFPSFVHLEQVQKELQGSTIKLGAQNFYPTPSGAFTGEVSGPMLVDYGCSLVLVGHSERRALFCEDLALIATKFKAAQQFGLKPVLCIGETREERENNQAEKIIRDQLVSVIEAAGINAFENAVIAYEPVWAIGTGLTATPEQAQAAHAFIRGLLAGYEKNIANRMQLLYGGSVKADNAAGLFAMPDIDGGLVGGASLDAKSFTAICTAAQI